MSNQWLRLWHDMPNDPKWRTIARISKQRIGDVLAVYMHLLTSASQHVTRGHADVTAEDLASAIDVTEDVIEAILAAMQGRVLEGFKLSGWEKRQPKREDSGNEESGAKSSAERKREQREREKATPKNPADNTGHDASRNVTLDKDKEEEKKNTPLPPSGADDRFEEFWLAYPKKVGKDAAAKAFAKRRPGKSLTEEIIQAVQIQKDSEQWRRDGGQYIPNPATWLNQGRWQDGDAMHAAQESSFV